MNRMVCSEISVFGFVCYRPSPKLFHLINIQSTTQNSHRSTMAASDQSDHRTMDSGQNAASLPAAFDQISLNRGAVATTITSMEIPPNLLNIPLEIRRSIYQYFLKFDKDNKFDSVDGSVRTSIILLHTCRQLRSEVLEYLAKNNTWIQISILSDQAVDLQDALWKAPRIPYANLPRQEREALLCERSLCIELGETTKTDNSVHENRVGQHTLFGYTTVSYAIVCEALVTLRNTGNLALSITVAPKFFDRNHTIIEDLILPFTIARDSTAVQDITIIGVPNSQLAGALRSGINGVNSSAGNFQDHLLALKEEGNRFFTKGHPAIALMYYGLALEVYQRSTHISLPPATSPLAEVNVIRSIFTDICNNWMHTSNTMLAKIRDVQGILPMASIPMILSIYAFSGQAFNWCGMSNQQRQKAHFRRAVAMHNLAEYCSNPEYVQHMYQHHSSEASMLDNADPDFHFVGATRQYFFSLQADTFSKSALHIASVYQKMCDKYNCYTSESPVMSLVRGVSNYEGGTWEGDPAMFLDRTDQEMRTALELSVSRDDKTMTKEEVKKMKRDLGVRGGRLDGLVRLLRPE